jgi:hypothetical protein
MRNAHARGTVAVASLVSIRGYFSRCAAQYYVQTPASPLKIHKENTETCMPGDAPRACAAALGHLEDTNVRAAGSQVFPLHLVNLEY